MADNFLLATLVLFVTGLLLSTAVTYRDCLAVRRIEGAMRRRQCILVFSDVVQIGFLSFGIASVIQNRPRRVGLAVTWALQCMACTNSTRILQPIYSNAWWPPVVLVALVPSVVLNGVMVLNIHGNAPATYEAVLLLILYVDSAFIARVGSSSLRDHESAGGSLNRSMRRLLKAIVATNEIAGPIACIGAGGLLAFLAQQKAELRIRIIIILPCFSAQVLYMCCFVLSYPERWISRLPLRSETSLELDRRPPTAG